MYHNSDSPGLVSSLFAPKYPAGRMPYLPDAVKRARETMLTVRRIVWMRCIFSFRSFEDEETSPRARFDDPQSRGEIKYIEDLRIKRKTFISELMKLGHTELKFEFREVWISGRRFFRSQKVDRVG